ncbi:hypothetical protein [Actinoplanes sp. URMC 104]|uniref:hypothetical protein n=1 Tax=Actinoplanes sp. URMC 104 TaxID=3423409 RepID=UPI003F1D35AD
MSRNPCGRVAVVGAGPAGMAAARHKVVGDSSPGGIVSQIAAVDEAEARFAAVRGWAA